MTGFILRRQYSFYTHLNDLLPDAEAPRLPCHNMTYGTDAGLSSSSSVQINPTVTDNVDPSPTVNCSHSSQYDFSFGETTVTCQATDESGNVDTCSFVVTVTGM